MAILSSLTPIVSEPKTAHARRCPTLCALALGAVLAGLAAAPLPASADMPAVVAGNQQIGHALRAATDARAAYAVYFAAAIDDCESVVGGCGSALSERRSAGNGGLETAALLRLVNGAAARQSERP